MPGFGLPNRYKPYHVVRSDPLGVGVRGANFKIPGLTRAFTDWLFLSGVAASYAGKGFQLKTVRNVISGSTPLRFQYYTGAPPAPPTIGILVTGLTTAVQIAAVTELAFLVQARGDLVVQDTGPAAFRLFQTLPGTLGNTDTGPDAGLDTLIQVNGFGFGAGISFFHNGQDGIPVRWGKNFGVMPTQPVTISGTPIG
jgi:hypothetical protein